MSIGKIHFVSLAETLMRKYMYSTRKPGITKTSGIAPFTHVAKIDVITTHFPPELRVRGLVCQCLT